MFIRAGHIAMHAKGVLHFFLVQNLLIPTINRKLRRLLAQLLLLLDLRQEGTGGLTFAVVQVWFITGGSLGHKLFVRAGE